MFCTPLLHLHENCAWPHEHFQWKPTRKIPFPCPVCMHVSTSLFHVGDANGDTMGAEQVSAAAAISTSDTGCFCFRINSNGKQDGSGCYVCEAKVKSNVPPVTNTPDMCKWGCPICACHFRVLCQKPNGLQSPLAEKEQKRERESQ